MRVRVWLLLLLLLFLCVVALGCVCVVGALLSAVGSSHVSSVTEPDGQGVVEGGESLRAFETNQEFDQGPLFLLNEN